MSLSPRDMDFIEARHAAAREIALALGVPPMLLAIPGDNTYSNYQEANRAFWRQTVLPLATRIVSAFSERLATPVGLRFVLNLDDVDALSTEREALWTRLEATTFLTPNEKRAAAGYDPIAAGADELKRARPEIPIGAMKGGYNPNQPRVPAGNGRESGEWAGGSGGEGDTFEVTPDPNLQEVARQRWRQFRGSPAQETRAEIANNRARIAIDRVRTLDPKWRGPTSAYNDIEGEIRHLESVAQAAEARYLQITRDAIPGVNPAWGVNRLRQELNERGYYFEHTTRAPGWRYVNPTTLEEVRIMQRPSRAYREDPVEKHTFEYYYRYRRRQGQGEGAHTPIPDKD